MAAAEEAENRHIAIWTTRKMIKCLDMVRGHGAYLITFFIPPNHQMYNIKTMLAEELGTAANIRNRTDRYYVIESITTVQQLLKLYPAIPENGLVLFCGTIYHKYGKQEIFSIDYVPFKPVKTLVYVCDKKFHVEHLERLLAEDKLYGFIIIDRNGTLFGSLEGCNREVLYTISANLPKKYSRNGQSAKRFARTCTEKRHAYLLKVCEIATLLFIKEEEVIVEGLIIAGSTEIKYMLFESELFDPRLRSKILTILELGYGGQKGFNDAISKASDLLSGVRFVQEKKLIRTFLNGIAECGNVCYGLENTIYALQIGAIETLIVWEHLNIERLELKSSSGATIVKHLSHKEQMDNSIICDENGAEMEVVDNRPLLEWFVYNHKSFGPQLEVVTDKSDEGAQFVSGFEGIGGLLRYNVDFPNVSSNQVDDEDEIEYNLDDYD